jgi:hippurate hydrolase
MKQIEECMRRTVMGVASAFGATAKLDFPDIFAPLVNNPAETAFVADVAADLVGEAHVDRNRSLIMGSEDFAYMLEACPGAFRYAYWTDDTCTTAIFSLAVRTARCKPE